MWFFLLIVNVSNRIWKKLRFSILTYNLLNYNPYSLTPVVVTVSLQFLKIVA